LIKNVQNFFFLNT